MKTVGILPFMWNSWKLHALGCWILARRPGRSSVWIHSAEIPGLRFGWSDCAVVQFLNQKLPR